MLDVGCFEFLFAMSVPELFIRRPVMTTLVMSGILLFGLVGYRLLPVSDLPSVDYPTIQVSASLPGANPDTMASSVATPLEKQFSIIAGVDPCRRSASLGGVQITIQFTLDRNIDAAAQDVQAAIARAGAATAAKHALAAHLPEGQPPRIHRFFISPCRPPRCRFRRVTIMPRRMLAQHFR